MSETMIKMKEVPDAIGAIRIALDYLSQKGIVVFSREVRSVFRNSLIWVVEADSKKFTGVIIVKADTGEVVLELPL